MRTSLTPVHRNRIYDISLRQSAGAVVAGASTGVVSLPMADTVDRARVIVNAGCCLAGAASTGRTSLAAVLSWRVDDVTLWQ